MQDGDNLLTLPDGDRAGVLSYRTCDTPPGI